MSLFVFTIAILAVSVFVITVCCDGVIFDFVLLFSAEPGSGSTDEP